MAGTLRLSFNLQRIVTRAAYVIDVGNGREWSVPGIWVHGIVSTATEMVVGIEKNIRNYIAAEIGGLRKACQWIRHV